MQGTLQGNTLPRPTIVFKTDFRGVWKPLKGKNKVFTPVGVVAAFTWAASRHTGKPHVQGALRFTEMAALIFTDCYRNKGLENIMAESLYVLIQWVYDMVPRRSKELVYRLVERGYLEMAVEKRSNKQYQVLRLPDKGRLTVDAIYRGLEDRERKFNERLEAMIGPTRKQVSREIKDLPVELQSGWIGELPI